MADIDRFKAVNDTHGHQAGDQAIRTVAEHLKAGLPETDYVARYGGEEFAVILFDILPDDAVIVADRVRHKISETLIRFEKHAFRVTISFGIATMYPDDEITKEELLNRADQALYRAKAAGRNCCRIDQPRLKCTAVDSNHDFTRPRTSLPYRS